MSAPARAPRAALLVGALTALAASPAVAQQSHLLVVSGLGGEPQYVDAFYRWGAAMVDAARGRFGLADSAVVFLAERPERDPTRIRARSTRENIEREFAELTRRAAPGDQVLVLLIGHGSADAGEPRLNLPGPDLTAAALAAMLAPLDEQAVAVVNTASASGAFLEALAEDGRVVVTSTRSGSEQNETIFGRFFVDAYAGDGADTDKDGRITLLEAFTFARREVERTYEQDNRLLTEHAMLDGNGDGQASVADAPDEPDALAAGGFVLAAASAAAPADPALQALHRKRTELERQIAELRAARDTIEASRYQSELERLLLELAEVGQAIRRAGGGS